MDIEGGACQVCKLPKSQILCPACCKNLVFPEKARGKVEAARRRKAELENRLQQALAQQVKPRLVARQRAKTQHRPWTLGTEPILHTPSKRGTEKTVYAETFPRTRGAVQSCSSCASASQGQVLATLESSGRRQAFLGIP